MAEHIMQFNDGGADWCVNCGTFDIYCGQYDCEPEQPARFDMSEPENFVRTFTDFFGEDGLSKAAAPAGV